MQNLQNEFVEIYDIAINTILMSKLRVFLLRKEQENLQLSAVNIIQLYG